MLRLSSALQAGRRQVSGRDKRPRRVIASVRPSIRAGLAHHVKASPELEAKINPEGNARDNPLLNQAKRAESSLKRFWKTASYTRSNDGTQAWMVLLDGRPMRTPGGSRLLVPEDRETVAALIAHEWEVAEKLLRTHALPMTSLMARAIDGTSAESARMELIASLLRYCDTDAICFHELKPEALVALQERHWTPLIDWAEREFQLRITVVKGEGFLARQSDETKDKWRRYLESLDPLQLAAFERIISATQSFIIGLALLKDRINAQQAAEAARVEVRAQVLKWGEVEDAHPIDEADIERQLGSAAIFLQKT